tara:strand:+ start:464 stop:1930 length:1467 start_codon:yes stop_codon:yes gene_type:complete
MQQNNKFEFDSQSLKTSDRRLGLGWLNNKRIKNPLLKEMLYNASEFWCINAHSCGWDKQFCEGSIEDIMTKAIEAGLDNILIIKIGITLPYLLESFGNWFKKEYKGEVLCGHILDKGEEYYELHPQCLMIDVKWWASLSDKSVGDESKTALVVSKPLRSQDNLHSGGYTPTWVTRGKEVCITYNSTRFGWNLIKQALDAPTGVRVWPSEVREMYDYIYPEVNDIESLNKGLKLFQGQPGSFYVSNTEDIHLDTNFPRGGVKGLPECNHVFTTAGGLSNLFEAYNYIGYSHDHCDGGPGSGNRLMVMDVNRGGLAMTKHIHNNWTGENYGKFIMEWAEDNYFNEMLKGKHTLDSLDSFIKTKPDFTRWFCEEFQPKLKDYTYYRGIDFYDVDDFKKRINKFVFETVMECETGEVHRMHFNFSNCLAFIHTAYLYNHQARETIRKQLLEYLWGLEAKHELLDIDVKYNIWWLEDERIGNIIDMFPWRKND